MKLEGLIIKIFKKFRLTSFNHCHICGSYDVGKTVGDLMAHYDTNHEFELAVIEAAEQ